MTEEETNVWKPEQQSAYDWLTTVQNVVSQTLFTSMLENWRSVIRDNANPNKPMYRVRRTDTSVFEFPARAIITHRELRTELLIHGGQLLPLNQATGKHYTETEWATILPALMQLLNFDLAVDDSLPRVEDWLLNWFNNGRSYATIWTKDAIGWIRDHWDEENGPLENVTLAHCIASMRSEERGGMGMPGFWWEGRCYFSDTKFREFLRVRQANDVAKEVRGALLKGNWDYSPRLNRTLPDGRQVEQRNIWISPQGWSPE